MAKNTGYIHIDLRAERKGWIRRLLQNRDIETILRWTASERGAERILNNFLFDENPLVRRRALEVFGRIAAVKAVRNPEPAREMVRRLFWAMNDESGNSVFHAPELIGEILAHVPGLISEFAEKLPYYLDDLSYRRGTLRAMARIAAVAPTAFSSYSGLIFRCLCDPDPEVRGLALQALSPEGSRQGLKLVENLRSDSAEFPYYDPDSGSFRKKTVGTVAEERLGPLK